MYYFLNDYSEGCHEDILKALTKTNLESTCGYGLDDYTKEAIALIKKEINNDSVDIHFLVGGTQTNLCVISLLKPYEAVISCDTAHINVHECGAIESTGHKILTVPNKNGKIDLDACEELINNTSSFHMVLPKMLYISNSTELGTIYTKSELIKLRDFCNKHNLYLYVDGARLGAALTAKSCDITFKDLAKYCDIFYIGGTKNGAMFGEALVILNDELKPNFKYIMKNKGAVLAKGRLLGIQFKELFTNKLFYKIGLKANEQANKLRAVFNKHNISYYITNDTNQVFIILAKNIYDKIKDQIACEINGSTKDSYILRFVTSFSTKDSDILGLDKLLYNTLK